MRKVSKIVVALCIVFTICMSGVSSFASGDGEDPFRPQDIVADAPTNANTLKDLGGKIVGVVRTVGIIVAIVILLILGIQYMIGSAEQKADYKKSMVPYLVGAVLVFAASTIAGIVYDMASALQSNGTDTTTGGL